MEIGADQIAIIEPKDTNLLILTIDNHRIAKTIAHCQFRARIVPKPEATHFPPVNPKKIDLLSQIRTATADKTGIIPQ